ncbi:unnamed protein product [Amoebophrya sp. A120]|nr:unnamed protein product [Amoebophrya sp. A120]|eukprot:GSA120T00011653001.1
MTSRPSRETEQLISFHLSPAKNKEGEADEKIKKRMARLATTTRTRNPGETKPLLSAIETWGTWLDVKSNKHVARNRSVPQPASTPGLVLEKFDVFAGFDASQVPKRRKGRRFRGDFMSLNHRKPIHEGSEMPPLVGPGRYNVERIGEIDPKRVKEPVSKFRLASSVGFTMDERWKGKSGFDWRPGPGAYGVPYVSMFPDETETRPWRPRGTVFGPDKQRGFNNRATTNTLFARTDGLEALQDSRAKILAIEEEYK